MQTLCRRRKNAGSAFSLHPCPISVPVHASWLYANNVLHYVKNLFKKGVGMPDMDDEIVQHSLVTYRGEIVHQGTLKAMDKG